MTEKQSQPILVHTKTFKVLATKHRQTKNKKEYEDISHRIYIPNRFFNLLPKEVQEYNTVEVSFDPNTLQINYTFKTPPPDFDKDKKIMKKEKKEKKPCKLEYEDETIVL